MDLIRARKEWPAGRDNRHKIIKNILESINIDTMETILVIYKIKDMIDKSKEIIFCIAYIEVDPDGRRYKAYFTDKRPDFLTSSSDLFFKGIFPSGSSISKDGEFRNSFINWDVIQIVLHKEPPLKKLYDAIHTYIVKNMKDRKYFLTLEHFYPTDSIKSDHQFELESITIDSKIRFFAITWFNFYFNYHYGVIPGHLNETFVNLMLKYETQDLDFFKKLVAQHTYEVVFRLMWILNNYQLPYSDADQSQKYKLGQKIVPLNLLEAQNPFNISYATWKEYFISRRASDLVVNDMTPGFSVFAGWLIVKTEDRFVFDNPDHIQRLQRSKIAEKITDILIQAQTYTFMHIDKNQRNPEIEDRAAEQTSWLSAEFKKLYYMIRGSINHAKDNIIMSNASLILLSEYLGRTLYNSAELSKKSKHFQRYMTNIIADDHYDTFNRYLFEICYNIFLLNDKLGVIHGDLHLNNILLNLIVYIYSTSADTKDKYILYSINKKSYLFAKFNFYYAALIDYSRSIVRYSTATNLRDPSIPITFPFIGDQEEFRLSQSLSLLEFLISVKPIYTERRHQLRDLINDKYDICFKVFSALDMYVFLQRLVEFLSSKEAKGASRRIVDKVNNMYHYIDNYISTGVQDLLDGRASEYANRRWPSLLLIEEFFSDVAADDEEITKVADSICDFYDADADPKYNLHDKYPPWLQFTKSESELIEEYEKKNKSNFKIVGLVMRRQREKHP